VVVNEHRHSLPHRIPGQNFSYSDHEPIEAVFELSVNTSSTERNITTNSSKKIFYIYCKIYFIFIFSGIEFENELLNVLNTALNICNEGNSINPLMSEWHFVLIIVCIVFIYIYTN